VVINVKKDEEFETRLVNLIREYGAELCEVLYFRIKEGVSNTIKKHRRKKKGL